MGKALKNAVHIGDDWEGFLNEHPELKVEYIQDGYINKVIFPHDATSTYISLFDGVVHALSYCIGNSYFKYERE